MFPVNLIFRLLFSTVQVDSSTSMMVTWGRPSNYSVCRTFLTNSWKSCLAYCYNSNSCVLVSSPVDPIDCQVYGTNEVRTVQKLTSKSNVMVAFKIINSQDTCPAGIDAPTFNNITAQGISGTTSTNYSHTIAFDGSQWSISYQQVLITTTVKTTTRKPTTTTMKTTTKKVATTTKGPCDASWVLFKRPAANWCMRVIAANNDTYSQDQAVALCASAGAVLSGIETQAERTYVANAGVTMLGSDYPNWAALWISGVRKTECATSTWSSIATCKNSITQFTFSDKYLTNYAGLTWDPTQPDRAASGTWQNCLCIWLRLPGAVTSDFVNGATDDMQCGLAKTQWYALRGAVCGKLASSAAG